MDKAIVKSNLLLLLAAFFWGTTFVAQRIGMDALGPLAFTGIRFSLGTLVLIPFLFRRRRRRGNLARRWSLAGMALAGLVLCLGINLQQFGLVYTTAANAAFITSLYVVIVPFLGLLLGHVPGPGGWLGALVAVVGLYFLSVPRGLSLAPGDGLVLLSAVVWAVHVIVIAWLSPRMDSYVLAAGQFSVCAVVSLAGALLFEPIPLAGVAAAAIPLLYGGLLSVGAGFTLQVVAQRRSPPTHVAVIMSLEAVFGAVGGWLVLREILSGRQILGCVLMLAGGLVTQLWQPRLRSPASEVPAGVDPYSSASAPV